jgi:PhoH-like ATPase
MSGTPCQIPRFFDQVFLQVKPRVLDRKLFVLDTNVLMHDPACLFRFKEHDLFIPMVVLEELDQAKKGLSEISRNARQTSRFLDELIHRIGLDEIRAGIPLDRLDASVQCDPGCSGRLFFEVNRPESGWSAEHSTSLPDNSILATTLALVQQHSGMPVVLVSKDINLRIKAAVLGITAEDYQNDQVLEDINLLYSGSQPLPEDF